MNNFKLTFVHIGDALSGLIALFSGGKAKYEGAAAKIGAAALQGLGDTDVLTELDNDFRFLAANWMIVGLGLLIGVVLIHSKPDLVQIGIEAIILGGLARAFAMTEYGDLPQYYGPVVVEVVLPIVLLILLKGHQRAEKRLATT